MSIGDRTLHEFAANGDGTFDGRKVVQWLFEATTGKPMSDEDAKKLVAEALARRSRKLP